MEPGLNSRNGVNRRAAFFVIDVFIAISFLIVGFLLVYSAYLKEPPASQTIYYSNDLMGFFSATRVSQLDDLDIYEMWCERCENASHVIANPDNTLLEQVLSFLYLNSSNVTFFYHNQNVNGTYLAEVLAKNATEGIVRRQFSYRIFVSLHNSTWVVAEELRSSIDSAKLALAAKDISYVLVNSSTVAGPFVTRIEVWA